MLHQACKCHLASPPLPWLAFVVAQHCPDLVVHFSETQRRVLLHTGGAHAASILRVLLLLDASWLP